MRNARLDYLREALNGSGFVRYDEDYLVRILAGLDATPRVVYELGDFVTFNEGMGEVGYGVVTTVEPQGYDVKYAETPESPDSASLSTRET